MHQELKKDVVVTKNLLKSSPDRYWRLLELLSLVKEEFWRVFHNLKISKKIMIMTVHQIFFLLNFTNQGSCSSNL
jgi:hypothetical protein